MANSTVLATVVYDAVTMAARSVQASIARPALDATPIGQSYTTMLHGVMSATFTLDVYFDKSDNAKLVDNLKNAESAKTLTITWNTAETWTGSALCTQCDVTADLNDLVRATITLVGTGTWVSGV